MSSRNEPVSNRKLFRNPNGNYGFNENDPLAFDQNLKDKLLNDFNCLVASIIQQPPPSRKSHVFQKFSKPKTGELLTVKSQNLHRDICTANFDISTVSSPMIHGKVTYWPTFFSERFIITI